MEKGTGEFGCSLITACKTCNALEYPNECCYWEAINNSRMCVHRKYESEYRCLRLNGNKLADELEAQEKKTLESLKGVKFKAASSLAAPYLPEIKPLSTDKLRGMEVVRSLQYPAIAISLEGFYRDYIHERPQLRQAKKVGLHAFLNYEGEITLTTDVNDFLCDRLLVNQSYMVKTINDLNPDNVTTPDSFTYHNLPAYISRRNMNSVLESLQNYQDVRCKVIGLVLGSNSAQITGFALRLRDSGLKLFAYPCYELRLLSRRRNYTALLAHRIRLVRKATKGKVLALSCTPGRRDKRILADYYSSYSWFPKSRRNNFLALGSRKLKRLRESSHKYSNQGEIDWVLGE